MPYLEYINPQKLTPADRRIYDRANASYAHTELFDLCNETSDPRLREAIKDKAY